MQQIIGKGLVAILNSSLPVKDNRDLLVEDMVYLLLKGQKPRSWLGLVQIKSALGKGDTSETSKEVWREEYYGKTDFSMYKVLPALKSVVPFQFSQNTYVKVKGQKAVFSLGSMFYPDASDTEAEQSESEKE